jgi:hypothetical protein
MKILARNKDENRDYWQKKRAIEGKNMPKNSLLRIIQRFFIVGKTNYHRERLLALQLCY